MLKITVISVCFNEKDRIKSTIESVCSQTYPDIEYLIIDGNSTDGTVEMIRQYSFKNKISFCSEKDYGIYNAMNRGIARASGDYICFLNAGDVFCNTCVIENVVSYIDGKRDTIYYGKVYLLFADGLKQIQDIAREKGTLKEKLFKGVMPCHQSIFAPRKSLVNHYFREEYMIRADFEWLIYSISKGYECRNIPVFICSFDTNGISSSTSGSILFQKEEQKILNEYQNYFTKDDMALRKEEMVHGREIWLKYSYMFRLMSQWLALRQKNCSIGEYLKKKGYKHLAIYGMGSMGQRLIDDLNDWGIEVDYGVDRNADNICSEIKIFTPDQLLEKTEVMIVTAVTNFYEIKEVLCRKVEFPIISLEEILNNMSIS